MLPRVAGCVLRATFACSAHKYSQVREIMPMEKLELHCGAWSRRGGHHDSDADSEAENSGQQHTNKSDKCER